MKKSGLLFLLILSASFSARAQSVLSFKAHTIFGFKNAVVQGDSVRDSVQIINHGPASFTGRIILNTGKDSAGVSRIFLDSIGFNVVALPADSTKFFTLTRNYRTAGTNPSGPYSTGINVVVIWPSITATNFTFKDSLRDTVTVLLVNGIQNYYTEASFNIYPNPAQTEVTISSPDMGDETIEEVKVYDLLGNALTVFKKQRVLDIANLPKGCWLLEVKFSNGRLGRKKLLIQ